VWTFCGSPFMSYWQTCNRQKDRSDSRKIQNGVVYHLNILATEKQFTEHMQALHDCVINRRRPMCRQRLREWLIWWSEGNTSRSKKRLTKLHPVQPRNEISVRPCFSQDVGLLPIARRAPILRAIKHRPIDVR